MIRGSKTKMLANRLKASKKCLQGRGYRVACSGSRVTRASFTHFICFSLRFRHCLCSSQSLVLHSNLRHGRKSFASHDYYQGPVAGYKELWARFNHLVHYP